MNAAASAFHVSVSFAITEDDSPAPVSRNWPSAGTKSPEDSPCRYSSGSTSVTCRVLRAHGGKIAEENRIRCPLPGVGALVIDPRCRHLHRARAGQHRPRLGGAVADHHPAAVLVPHVG